MVQKRAKESLLKTRFIFFKIDLISSWEPSLILQVLSILCRKAHAYSAGTILHVFKNQMKRVNFLLFFWGVLYWRKICGGSSISGTYTAVQSSSKLAVNTFPCHWQKLLLLAEWRKSTTRGGSVLPQILPHPCVKSSCAHFSTFQFRSRNLWPDDALFTIPCLQVVTTIHSQPFGWFLWKLKTKVHDWLNS